MIFDANLIFWPIFTLILAAPTILFIPRHEYKKYFLFSFILGGFLDVISIIVIGNFLGEFNYLGGPLMVMGIPIFAPLAYTFAWMNFLFFLPYRIEFLVPYIIGFSGFSVILGFVEQNLGFFRYNYGFTRGALVTGIITAIWLSFTAWVFRKYQEKLPS